MAFMGNVVLTELLEVSTNPEDLEHSGFWFVTQSFEGEFQAFRFANSLPLTQLSLVTHENRQKQFNWTSSMSEAEYCSAVQTIRDDIARGWVYQANLCRILSAPVAKDFDIIGLYLKLLAHNPAPHACALWVSKDDTGIADVAIASASPELFLSRRGRIITTSPIKGTADKGADLLTKDEAENIMIVDLMRNDLSQVCEPGSVHVPELLRTEEHPGLVHLVSDVRGTLRDHTSWATLLDRLSPPGSVSGAPKSSAIEVIQRLEPTPRNIYCGILGVVDSTTQVANLAVGIRTFWLSSHHSETRLNFGTGAGITWGSDPQAEWNETELKARRLLSIASAIS